MFPHSVSSVSEGLLAQLWIGWVLLMIVTIGFGIYAYIDIGETHKRYRELLSKH